MDSIDNVYNGLSGYFNALEQMGHYRQSTAYRLLLYSFLVSTVFHGGLQKYLSDEDLPVINRLLHCLGKDPCIISMVPCEGKVGKPNDRYIHNFRATEDNSLRSTESDLLRGQE